MVRFFAQVRPSFCTKVHSRFEIRGSTMSAQLMPGERPLLAARQHWSAVAPPLGAALAALVIGIVILVLTPAALACVGTGGGTLTAGIARGVLVCVWAGLVY